MGLFPSTEIINSSEECQTFIDTDLRAVGADKPLGYLPYVTLDKAGVRVEDIASELESRGLGVLTVTGFGTEELYAYDPVALPAFLYHYASVLRGEGWPTDVIGFIKKVSKGHNDRLQDLISEAFGN